MLQTAARLDCSIICSIFGYLQQWRFAQYLAQTFAYVGVIYFQLLNEPSKIGKDFQNIQSGHMWTVSAYRWFTYNLACFHSVPWFGKHN